MSDEEHVCILPRASVGPRHSVKVCPECGTLWEQVYEPLPGVSDHVGRPALAFQWKRVSSL